MIKDIIAEKYDEYLDGLTIHENNDSLKIPKIVIKKEFRGTGIGSDIMKEIVRYADQNKQLIVLTPSSDFGGNKNKLVQWYKRFGFKHNKGQYKNYEYTDTMIRYPHNIKESRVLNFNDFLNEGLVKKGKNKEIMNYNSIIAEAWRTKIKEAMAFQKVSFDLENNDVVEKHTLFIDKNLRKDQPIKYEFNIELCSAGGDWETPVLYFKIEFTTNYMKSNKGISDPKYIWELKPEGTSDLSKSYVLIPTEVFNSLVKTENGYTAQDAEAEFKMDKTNYKAAWDWVEDILTTVVEERHEMLDQPNGSDEEFDKLPKENESLSPEGNTLTAEVPQFDEIKTLAVILSDEGLAQHASKMFPNTDLAKAMNSKGILSLEDHDKLFNLYNTAILKDYALRAKYEMIGKKQKEEESE